MSNWDKNDSWTSSNSWQSWSKHVLNELERHNDKQEIMDKKIDDLKEQITKIRVDIAGVKVRAGYWGAMAGVASALVTFFVLVVTKVFR